MLDVKQEEIVRSAANRAASEDAYDAWILESPSAYYDASSAESPLGYNQAVTSEIRRLISEESPKPNKEIVRLRQVRAMIEKIGHLAN